MTEKMEAAGRIAEAIERAVRGMEPPRPPAPKATPRPPRTDLIFVGSLEDGIPPPRRWCVPEWIPDHNVTSIYGDGGTGKSLLAMQLATACALGSDFLGMDVARRKVLYVSCEDDRDELHRRQHAINTALGLEMPDFEDRYLWLDRAGQDSIWMHFPPAAKGRGRLTAFAENVTTIAKDNGCQLVVIDTAADTFGGNEIIRSEVRQFITALRKLAMEIDGAVVLLAHPSAAGLRDGTGYSGSTAWRGSVRSLLTFEFEDGEDASPDRRILTRKKANYAKSGTAITLRYASGVFLPEHPPVDEPSALNELCDDDLFLRHLRGLLDRGLCPSAAKNRDEFAPKLMKRTFARDLVAVTVGRLEQAMRRLLERGEIAVRQHRSNSSPLCPKDYDLSKWRKK